jgi:hypothetical protein
MHPSQQQQFIPSNNVRVTIGYQVFEIPAERIHEVTSLLTRLQSIKIEQNKPNYGIGGQYNGQSLVCG